MAVETLECRRLLSGSVYQWQNAAIGGGGFVDGVIFSPTQPGVVYARTDIGGAYASTDGGAQWHSMLDFAAPGNGQQLGVLSLAVDPENPQNIYLDVGQYSNANGWVLSSTNGGESFSTTNLPFWVGGNSDGRGDGERLAVDPNLGNVLLLGSNANGLYSSDNSAQSFAPVSSFDAVARSTSSVTFVAFDPNSGTPGNPTQSIYVGVNSTAAGTNIYHSDDGGATWSELAATPGAPTGLLPTHGAVTSDGNLYLTYANAQGPNGMTTGGVWRYDSGVWANISPVTPGALSGDNFGYGGLAVDPENPATIVVTSDDRWNYRDQMWRTTSANTAAPVWTALYSGPATRNTSSAPWVAPFTGNGIGNWAQGVAIDPFNGAHILYGDGQGLWATTTATAATTQWTFDSTGIEFTSVTDLAAPGSGIPLYSTLGDINGFSHTTLISSPAAGANLAGGKIGSDTAVDFAQDNPDFAALLGSAANGGAYTTNDGATWTAFAASAGSGGSIAVSANGSTLAWAPGGQAPYFSTNDGTTWTASALPSARCWEERSSPTASTPTFSITRPRTRATTSFRSTSAPTAARRTPWRRRSLRETRCCAPTHLPRATCGSEPITRSITRRILAPALHGPPAWACNRRHRSPLGRRLRASPTRRSISGARSATSPDSIALTTRARPGRGSTMPPTNGAARFRRWPPIQQLSDAFTWGPTGGEYSLAIPQAHCRRAGSIRTSASREIQASRPARPRFPTAPSPTHGSSTAAAQASAAKAAGRSINLILRPRRSAAAAVVAAQVGSLDDPGTGTSQAGVMILAASGPGDPFVALLQTSSDQLVLESRASSGAAVSSTVVATVPATGEYLEIVRSGSDFSALVSSNRQQWTHVGAMLVVTSIPLAANVGVAVAAGDNSQLASAVFASVTVAGGPGVASAAVANPTPGVGTSTTLSVLGSDPAGESTLTYTWATTGMPPAPVVFSTNGSNAAQTVTANFTAAGTYNFNVTIADEGGLTTTSSVSVMVDQTLTRILVTPATASLALGTTAQFSATALDQFGNALTTQPASFAWSVSSGPGSIGATGIYTASHAGSAIVEASSGGVAGSAAVTVAKATPTLTWPAPAAIVYGTAVTGTQLDAAASVAGAFAYSPVAGAVLKAGTQILSVTFTPTDITDYNSVSTSVTLLVNKAATTITAANVSAVYGASAVTLTATVSSTTAVNEGTVTFTIKSGNTVLGTVTSGTVAGGNATATFPMTGIKAGGYSITASYQPAASGADFNTSSTKKAAQLTVKKATPAFSGLSSPSISPGTKSTTLSGTIKDGSLIPTGNVRITLNGVVHTAAINSTSGLFSSAFTTSALAAGTYTITYDYLGGANFNSLIVTTSLTVT